MLVVIRGIIMLLIMGFGPFTEDLLILLAPLYKTRSSPSVNGLS